MKKLIYIVLTGFILIGITTPLAAAVVDVYEAPDSDGYIPWNAAGNIATYNAWLAAVGMTPQFREDWDGLDWQGNPWFDTEMFDIQNVPGAIFSDGVTFGNIGSQADRRAIAEDSIGSTDAIDLFGWRAHESGVSTVDFSQNGADFLGFYIFDTDHGADVNYILTFSDDSVFNYSGLATDEDRYRFVGFVNNHPSAKITKFEITAESATRYGIDELEWGRNENVIPEPSTFVMLSIAGLFAFLKKKRKPE